MSNSPWGPITEGDRPVSPWRNKASSYRLPPSLLSSSCFSASFPMVLTHKCQPLEWLPVPRPLESSLWALSSHPRPLSAGHPSRHGPLVQRRPLRCSFLAGTFHRQKWFASEDWCARWTLRVYGFPARAFTQRCQLLPRHWPVPFHWLSLPVICFVSQISFHFSQLHLGLRPRRGCQEDSWRMKFSVSSTTILRGTACASPPWYMSGVHAHVQSRE